MGSPWRVNASQAETRQRPNFACLLNVRDGHRRLNKRQFGSISDMLMTAEVRPFRAM
jgi:hypothetical protein